MNCLIFEQLLTVTQFLKIANDQHDKNIIRSQSIEINMFIDAFNSGIRANMIATS